MNCIWCIRDPKHVWWLLHFKACIGSFSGERKTKIITDYSNILLFHREIPHARKKTPANILHQINKQVSARGGGFFECTLCYHNTQTTLPSQSTVRFSPPPKHLVQATAPSSPLSSAALEPIRELSAALQEGCQSGVGTAAKLLLLAMCLYTKYNALHIQVISAQGSFVKLLPFPQMWCSISY